MAPSSLCRYCIGLLTAVVSLPLFAAGAVVAPAASCAGPAPVTLAQDPQWIDRGVEVLFDAQRRYRLEDVIAPERCADFRPVAGIPAFGIESRGVWLRLRLPDRAWDSTAWRLLVPFGATDRFCVHWPVLAGGYQSECADVRQPLRQGGRALQGWYFSLPARFDAARPVLLYTQGERVVEARLAVGTADAIAHYLYNRQILLGAYCGLMLSLALFGLVMFAAQREPSYAYFSAYITLGVLYYAAQGNYFSSLGFAGLIAIRVEYPLAALGALCMTRFLQSWLDTRVYTPRLHRLALLLLVPFLVIAFALPLLPVDRAIGMLQVCAAFWTAALMAALGTRVAQGSRAAVYGLVAFAVPMIGGTLRSLEHYGRAVVDPQLGEGVAFAGHVLASGVLAAGLIQRVRRLARERDQAKDLALSSQQLALHRAHYDDVTHLPNRAKFREELQMQLMQAGPGQRCALVTLGLDRFGTLNDALGHEIGDSVLGEIARRLQQVLGERIRLARIGADLFAWLVVLPAGPEGIDALRRDCAALQQTVTAPLRLGGEHRLTASCGVALYPDHAAHADQLLQFSDAALHRAKLRGGGSFKLFDPALHQTASRYLQLHRELHEALPQGALELYYQPIVSLASGRLLGVESLARWRREDGQFVAPDQFVPVAESGDLLRAFTEWGLRRFYAQLVDWRNRGVGIPYASFNLSAAQLRLDDIGELLLTLLHESGAPASRVTLEVTEGTLLDNLEATRSLLMRLKQEGMSVAVDDFGVGYASPHYLRVLPVDILKLDGVFLRGVPQDEQANAVLDSLITLGHSLQLKIVSECVETGEQARYLAARGVAGAQGYFFSRALPADELEAWLQTRWDAAVA